MGFFLQYFFCHREQNPRKCNWEPNGGGWSTVELLPRNHHRRAYKFYYFRGEEFERDISNEKMTNPLISSGARSEKKSIIDILNFCGVSHSECALIETLLFISKRELLLSGGWCLLLRHKNAKKDYKGWNRQNEGVLACKAKHIQKEFGVGWVNRVMMLLNRIDREKANARKQWDVERCGSMSNGQKTTKNRQNNSKKNCCVCMKWTKLFGYRERVKGKKTVSLTVMMLVAK